MYKNTYLQNTNIIKYSRLQNTYLTYLRTIGHSND